MFSGMVALSLLACGAPATSAPQPRTVLVLPLEAGAGVSKSSAEAISQLLATFADKQRGYRVNSIREIEKTLSVEQMNQLSGCSTTSCALEIAGAINADEIIVGTLSKVGDTHVFSASRIIARSGVVVSRVSGVFPDGKEDAIVARLPALTAELFAPGKEQQPNGGEARAPLWPKLLAGAGGSAVLLGAAGVLPAALALVGAALVAAGTFQAGNLGLPLPALPGPFLVRATTAGALGVATVGIALAASVVALAGVAVAGVGLRNALAGGPT